MALVTVISRTDIDLLLNDLSRPGSDAEAVTVKQRRVTHWHSESSWLSAPTNMFASFPLNGFCPPDSLHGKRGCFSLFLEFLFGPGSDNYGNGCPLLSSLTLFSSQIWRGDQTCFHRRPVWTGDYSEAGAGQLQSRHHIQGTHWYETMLISILKSLYNWLASFSNSIQSSPSFFSVSVINNYGRSGPLRTPDSLNVFTNRHFCCCVFRTCVWLQVTWLRFVGIQFRGYYSLAAQTTPSSCGTSGAAKEPPSNCRDTSRKKECLIYLPGFRKTRQDAGKSIFHLFYM